MSKEVTLEEVLDIDKRVITVEEFSFILGSINNAITTSGFCGYEEDDNVAFPDLIQYLESQVGEKGFIILDNETDVVHLGRRD